MKIRPIGNKQKTEKFLREDSLFHVYGIGDLDALFFSNTKWYGLEKNEKLQAILLIYKDKELPVLLALNHKSEINIDLDVRELSLFLPRTFYAHLTLNFERILRTYYNLNPFEKHYKMGLGRHVLLEEVNALNFINLDDAYQEQIQELLEESYPDNWFNVEMLKTEQYHGILDARKFVGTVKIHIYSEEYRVVALGDLAMHPNCRNKGLGKYLINHLCQNLRLKVDHIGLNVATNNHATMKSYKDLGFEIVGEYKEMMFTSLS